MGLGLGVIEVAVGVRVNVGLGVIFVGIGVEVDVIVGVLWGGVSVGGGGELVIGGVGVNWNK